MSESKAKQLNDIHSVPWYPNEFPAAQEAVTVRLTRVEQMGVWCELLEYGTKEAMIPVGQYTTRKSRRLPKTVKVGKIDVALVSEVDAEKGNMDLTRQGLKEEDIAEANKRFNDYKNLISLINCSVCPQVDTPFEELVREIVYPLHEQYGNAYVAVQNSFKNPAIVENLNISKEAKEALLFQVRRMFTPQEVRIHALFEAEVLTANGVDDLRAALTSGYELAPEKGELKLTVIAPPLYGAALEVLDDVEGLEVMKKVLAKIEENIKAAKGRFTIKEEPKAMNQRELEKFEKTLKDLDQGGEDVDMDELEGN